MSDKSKREQILDLLRQGPQPSWKIVETVKTADYRRRITDLRKRGFVIESFTKEVEDPRGQPLIQHYYQLVREPDLPDGNLLPPAEPEQGTLL